MGRKPGLEKRAKATDKAKQTFNLWRGCKLCLQGFNRLIVAAGAADDRNTFNPAVHYS